MKVTAKIKEPCISALKESHEAIRAAWAPRPSECERRGECGVLAGVGFGCAWRCENVREPLDENGASECYDCLAKLAREREAAQKARLEVEQKAREALDRVDRACELGSTR